MPLVTRQDDAMIGLTADVTAFKDKVELDSSNVTVFEIECSMSGSTWTIDKRYSDFHSFESNLKNQVSVAAPFPPKLANKLASLTPAQKEERKTMLGAWVVELLKMPLSHSVVAQIFNFFDVTAHTDGFESASSMMRHTPGRVHMSGYVSKFGGRLDDPYNVKKGKWTRCYMVLQDDLRYFQDEAAFKKGGAPKGIVSLDTFCVSEDGTDAQGCALFTVHSVPAPLMCRTDDLPGAAAWVAALEAFAYGGYTASMVKGKEDDDFRQSTYVPDL